MKFPSNAVQMTYASPLGAMHLAASGDQLVGVWFEDQAHLPPQLQDPANETWPQVSQHAVLTTARDQLVAYFKDARTLFDVPLHFESGTAFQQAVWRTLLTITPGRTQSYGQVSASLGKPAAVRAVGAAVGRNPFSVIVPCHRVLGSTGALTGYAGGLERKTALLQAEGAAFR